MTKGESLSLSNRARFYNYKTQSEHMLSCRSPARLESLLGHQLVAALQIRRAPLPLFCSLNGIFVTFPFLLPDLICAVLCMTSITAGYLLLIETHPGLRSGSTQAEWDNSTAETSLLDTSEATADTGVDLRADSYGTSNDVAITEEK